MKEESLKHRSYGMISASKAHCSEPLNFYGAEIKHEDFIVLRIATSTLYRQLYNDRHTSDDKIIEVRLTPTQWAEFLTTMNTQGVPCTIEFTEKSGSIEAPPILTDKINLHKEEFDSNIKDCIEEAQDAIANLEHCVENNKGKRALRMHLGTLRNTLTNVIPNLIFANKQFEKHIDKVVTEGKQKIDSVLNYRISNIGISQLQLDKGKRITDNLT